MQQHGDETPQDPFTPFFEAWARFVLRHRWLCLALTVLSTAFMAQQAATKQRVDTTVEAFLAHESDSMRVLNELRDDFGRDELFFVMVEGDVFTLPFLEQLKRLQAELGGMDLKLETLGHRGSAVI